MYNYLLYLIIPILFVTSIIEDVEVNNTGNNFIHAGITV
jgi:hypothetical protein